jgi:hypothetical protein
MIGMGKGFLNRVPIAQEIKARNDKGDCIKLKSFCTAKETINRLRMGENLCQTFIQQRIHNPQYIKSSKFLTPK